MAIKTLMYGPGEGQAAMVGLHCAAGDDGICPLSKSIGDAEVEFTGFVAPGTSGKQIVTLDVNIHLAAQRFGEVGQILDGRSFPYIAATGKFGEIHWVTPENDSVTKRKMKTSL